MIYAGAAYIGFGALTGAADVLARSSLVAFAARKSQTVVTN
jgi:hypothetical protein